MSTEQEIKSFPLKRPCNTLCLHLIPSMKWKYYSMNRPEPRWPLDVPSSWNLRRTPLWRLWPWQHWQRKPDFRKVLYSSLLLRIHATNFVELHWHHWRRVVQTWQSAIDWIHRCIQQRIHLIIPFFCNQVWSMWWLVLMPMPLMLELLYARVLMWQLCRLQDLPESVRTLYVQMSPFFSKFFSHEIWSSIKEWSSLVFHATERSLWTFHETIIWEDLL